jgi:hypothetical protein
VLHLLAALLIRFEQEDTTTLTSRQALAGKRRQE